jgi:c-di-GMP-related signal transduction protein
MVSLFPAMLRILLADLLRLLPLREKARDALLGKGSREGALLQWLVFQEHGNWAGCDEINRSIGLSHEQAMRLHAEAVAWASAAHKSQA